MNDATEDVEFAERRANGETGARLNLKPKGRQSAETQLSAEWVAYLGNGTVVGRKKVWLLAWLYKVIILVRAHQEH